MSNATLTNHPTSASTLTFVVCFVFLAFLHFTSGLRRNRELKDFDLYLAINVGFNLWIAAIFLVYAFDALGGRGNVVISGALFFPVWTMSLASILAAKGGIRIVSRIRNRMEGGAVRDLGERSHAQGEHLSPLPPSPSPFPPSLLPPHPSPPPPSLSPNSHPRFAGGDPFVLSSA